jgi:sporulation protein YlmC with PRC-barrel domain
MAEQKTGTGNISSNTLLGSVVRNHEGERLGRVEELLVHPKDGLVISFIMVTRDDEGSERRIAVPWDMVDVKSNGEINLGIENEFLQRIPEYGGEP